MGLEADRMRTFKRAGCILSFTASSQCWHPALSTTCRPRDQGRSLHESGPLGLEACSVGLQRLMIKTAGAPGARQGFHHTPLCWETCLMH